MRLIGAVLLAVAVSSRTAACPIDLAPCEEFMRPVTLSIDEQITRAVLMNVVELHDDVVVLGVLYSAHDISVEADLALLSHGDDVARLQVSAELISPEPQLIDVDQTGSAADSELALDGYEDR